MKDKRNILKLASLIEFIYVLIFIIFYIIKGKIDEKVIANLFLLTINLITSIILFKESKKEIICISKTKICISGIIFLLNTVIPGILCFLYLFLIKDKKEEQLPKKNKEIISLKNKIISTISILIFIFVMFLLPEFSIYKNIPKFLLYIFLFLLVLIPNIKTLKNDLLLFIKYKDKYSKFIIKRYIIMLIVMIIVATPIILLNKGNVSTNQKMINVMLKKNAIITILLSCIYAPFTEEGIFRLLLSKIINNKTLFIITSGFLFGIMHMIDKFTSFYDLLYIFQYASLGICLAKAYTDSNNIFVPISMHFIQNFLASLLVILFY